MKAIISETTANLIVNHKPDNSAGQEDLIIPIKPFSVVFSLIAFLPK